MRISSLIAHARRGAASALVLAIGACASAGSTYQSGVGDRLVERPPFYAGKGAPTETARIGHFAVTYQRGSIQSPIFEPAGGEGTPIDRLLGEMNAYLDSLGATTRVSVDLPRRATPPDVRFGCETDATGDCLPREGALGRGSQPMRLAVGRPSTEWIDAASTAMQQAGVSTSLVITLELGDYFLRQRGFAGHKEVELGTGYTASFPWMTSLETPITVVQLTGALVGTDGKALKIGAEGMYPKRTRFMVSAIGAQELVRDEDIEQLRTARRDDLPGRPLVWQVALRNLVGQLTGRNDLIGG